MRQSISFAILMTFLFIGSSFTTTSTQLSTWKKLGSKKISYKMDKDVIRVGAKDGIFKKVKISVTGGNVNMHKMVIEYGNGTKDNIPLKYNFSKGNTSRTIDLEGNNRIIKDITFWYDTKNSSKRRATVHVFGKR